MDNSTARCSDDTAAATLLGLVQDLVAEVHPQRFADRSVMLDDSIDRDLGLDSLSRLELLGRIERSFEVTVPERVFADAETPRDLLRALLGAEASTRPVSGPEISAGAASEIDAVPRGIETLIEALNWHASSHPDRTHVRFYTDEGEGNVISYGHLKRSAEAVANGLQQLSLAPGEPIALILPTGADYFYAFFGILMAGGIPVPIYPPVRWLRIGQHLERHRSILDNCRVEILITVPEAMPMTHLFRSRVESLKHCLTVDDLISTSGKYEKPTRTAGDVAFLQYTSGSTGSPKGVILTHANLLANLRAMGDALKVDSTDVFVSWLPLYHDMGLIGSWLGSLYFGAPLVIMSPLSFVAMPHRWLRAIHRYRGTLSPAPNFGYELCLRRVREEDLQGLDLSSWRVALNGAEPVSPQTMLQFCKRFAKYGFREETMLPVYGLAECSVGLAFPAVGRAPVIDEIKREFLTRNGRAQPADDSASNPLRFVSCGRPLSGHEIRIVDRTGRELPDRQEGHLEFRGPSATSGYFRNPKETCRLFRDDWLVSGDLAYIANGDVYLTGRSKDIIIRAGRNIYPQELEEAVGDIPGILKGNVAVFGSASADTGTDTLVIVAETRKRDPEALDGLITQVNAVSAEITGTPPDEVVLAPPRSTPKTSSGKIRRAASRELYEKGEIGERHVSPWWSLVRLRLTEIAQPTRRIRRGVGEGLFAGTCWSLCAGVAPFLWLSVVFLPWPNARWGVMRSTGKLLSRLLRIPITVHGLRHIQPAYPSVLAANHASYLDGYVLVTALPLEISFVAKAELKDTFIIRAFLNRMGAEFVERFDRTRGLEDARRIGRSARRGSSLLFFPEGTFTRVPGVLPFHLGAFAVAAEMGLPVVPVAIRGTRSILRADSWFPRRGAITVTVGNTINTNEILKDSGDDAWATALKLRAATREHILRYCGEPDLAMEKSPI